jgi:hypothetical protein
MQDEFKEIQLKDIDHSEGSVEAPRLLNIPMPVYSIGNLGFAPQQIPTISGGLLQPVLKGHDLMVVAINERDERFRVVLSQAKVVKVLSVLDALAVFLYLVVPLYPLLVLLPGGLFGFCAGARLSRVMSICFLLYLALCFVLRIVLCAVVELTVYQVLQGILVGFLLCEVWLTVRFYRTLGTLSSAETDELKVQMQGLFSSKPLHTLQNS